MGRSHFGDQEHVVAATNQRIADQLLGRAVTYTSAVSTRVMPRSSPRWSAATSASQRSDLRPCRGPLPEHRNWLAEWKLEPPDGRGRHAGLLALDKTRGLRAGPSHRESAFTARKVAQTRPRGPTLARGQVLSQYGHYAELDLADAGVAGRTYSGDLRL